MPLTRTEQTTPRNYLLVLYPGHQLLDSAGPLDILSTVAKNSQVANTDITLTVIAETNTRIPLATVPPRNADWAFEITPELQPSVKENGRLNGSGFDLPLVPHLTFAEALKSLRTNNGEIQVENVFGEIESRSIDVLLIPGGIGSRLNRVDNRTGEKTLNVASVVDFVSEICVAGWVRSAVLTVCTGSDILARTGLLQGRRATTNWNAFDTVSGRHQGVSWLRGTRWVRSLPQELVGKEEWGSKFEREIWTSAGISAGMDLMLWFVAEVYGREFARGIARRLEYEWRESVGEAEIDPYY